jgi:phosphoglycerate kinase
MEIERLSDLNLKGKRVLIREDFNVPIREGRVVSDTRIRAALPTIELAISRGAQVILMSHLGRPIEGTYNREYSLQPVATHLSELMGRPVDLLANWQSGHSMADGDVVLMENVRFNSGETANHRDLAKAYGALCDIFVMDAFGTAHRAQASTYGVAEFAPVACAGPLLTAELDALKKVLTSPTSPVVAIVGGAKVSTKLMLLEKLADSVDHLIVGGGIANTFLAAAGKPVGRSLCEPDLIPVAQALMTRVKVPLPTDVVVATECSADATAKVVPVDAVADHEMILDIGPESAVNLANTITSMETIVWNGPLGVFELDQFAEGTKVVSLAIANSAAFSIAGGGDTLAAVDKYGIADQVSYISTGGGAFLEYIEGRELPAVAMLKRRYQKG